MAIIVCIQLCAAEMAEARPTTTATLAPPTVTGPPYKDSVLTCVPAQPPDPALVSWSWTRDGETIQDATAATYLVASADVGHQVGCTETVTATGVSELASSAEIEIVLVPVQILDEAKRVQAGPTLTASGEVIASVADGPAPAGRLLLITLRGRRTVVARSRLRADGSFSLSETIRALIPGRYPFRIEFIPADPELDQTADLLLTVTAISPATYPFARSAADRTPTIFDGLTAFWNDGAPCSVGCRPSGAIAGWPLRPFHEQHALRAGLNELRLSGFHVGIDIMALDREKVYAIQSGFARILEPRGIDARVLVGNYIYWHLKVLVHEGQRVRAYRTVIGLTLRFVRHLHLSEVDGRGRYLNPLRPGGRVLTPWADTEPPVIGRPIIYRDGSVIVDAFDPQSYVPNIYYATPVLAPAALAYRLFDSAGTPLTPLEWALRGSQWLPRSLVGSIFAPGTESPGYLCFALRSLCIPRWHYRLAGGLAPRLPLARLRGRCRLTIYAWDWAGNVTARDSTLNAAS